MLTTAEPTRSRDELRTEIARYAKTRDPSVRARLVRDFAGFSNAMAARFAQREDSLDDLKQEAAIGLMNALDRFDPSRNVEFATFAWATISGELKRYLRDRSWAVRVSRAVHDNYIRTRAVRDELRLELRREPTSAELAERCGTDERELSTALRADTARNPASLDGAVPSGAGEIAGARDPSFETVEDRQVIGQLLDVLPANQREVLRLHFFAGLTQTEVGRCLGVSQAHVSRLMRDALEHLRDHARMVGAGCT